MGSLSPVFGTYMLWAATTIDKFPLLKGTREKKAQKGWRKLGERKEKVADPLHCRMIQGLKCVQK